MRKSIVLSFVIALLIVIITIIAIEHPFYIKGKSLIVELGLIDKQYVIETISDITVRDHIQGNPDGEIIIIEYSDLTCVFCALMRDVFDRLQREYDNIRLVYRHFYPTKPREALKRAIAAECVASISGDDVFFEYINKLYDNQLQITDEILINYATELGVNITAMKKCVENEDTLPYILSQSEEIERLGAGGTPYILLIKDNKPIRFFYALPYDNFVEVLVEEVGGENLSVE